MISLADLEHERAVILRDVLSAILRSDPVQNVLAQVIDSIPIESTYEFATTMRSEIPSRTVPLSESMLLSRTICDSGDTLDSMDLDSTVWFPDSRFGGTMANRELSTGRSTLSKFCPIFLDLQHAPLGIGRHRDPRHGWNLICHIQPKRGSLCQSS